MKYRTLGKSGLKVSVIGMGTWQFGGEWGRDYTQAEVTPMFARAHELGINFIDTAECYGDHTSEQFIGQALRELNLRDQFLIATKFGHKFNAPFSRTEPRAPAEVMEQLDASLATLQTDYIDLYQYHSWGDDQFFRDDVRAVLEKAKAAGKILHLGNSISNKLATTRQLEEATKYHVESVQLVYNRLTRLPEDHYFPILERQRVGVLARVPLASGFLSGKYKPGDRFPENDVRTKWQSAGMDDRLAEVEKIQKTEVPAGTSMAAWALAWCLKSPAVQCVIPGCKNVEQVESNAAAADLPMVDLKHPWAAK